MAALCVNMSWGAQRTWYQGGMNWAAHPQALIPYLGGSRMSTSSHTMILPHLCNNASDTLQLDYQGPLV